MLTSGSLSPSHGRPVLASSSGGARSIFYDLRRAHSIIPVPVPRNRTIQTISTGASSKYTIKATTHAAPTSQIMMARGTGSGSTTGLRSRRRWRRGNCSYRRQRVR